MIRYILVDDDDITLAFVKNKIDSISKEYGLQHVNSYNSSKLAFENIIGNEYDLLIVDYEMPVYNGVELAQRIANDKNIIFLTSTTNNEKEIINNVSIAGYLSKPFDVEEFKRILKNKIINSKKRSNERKDNHFINVGTTKNVNIQINNTYYISKSLISASYKDKLNGVKNDPPKKNHVHIYGKDDKLLFPNVRRTINELIEELEPMGFIKINQSTIVNKNLIKERDNINISLYDCKETFEITKKKNFFINRIIDFTMNKRGKNP